MHFPLSFCKNASPYFFHGAFAPSFIWSRCPCRPLRSIGFTFTLRESTRYTIYSIMSITLQRYLTQKHKVLHTVHLAYIFTMQVLRRLGGAKPPQAPPQTPLMSTYLSHLNQKSANFTYFAANVFLLVQGMSVQQLHS